MRLSSIFRWSTCIAVGSAALYIIAMPFAARHLHHHQQETFTLPKNAAVLTGGQGRVQTALGLVEAGNLNTLYISGASSPLNSILQYGGFEDENITFKDSLYIGRAKNTRENAAEVANWVRNRQLKEILVITSDYHMARALREIGDALADSTIKITPYPVGKMLDFPEFYKPQNAYRIIGENYALLTR